MATLVQESMVSTGPNTTIATTAVAVANAAGNDNTLVEEDGGEESDTFVANNQDGTTTRPVFDLSLVNRQPDAARRPRRSADEHSVATTTDLATSVGSVMMGRKEAFLKSFTFYPLKKDKEGGSVSDSSSSNETIQWGITFGAPKTTSKGFLSTKNRLPVAAIEEHSIFALSRIREGDYLKSINGKTIGPSFTPDRALAKMKESLAKDGYLTVTTKNKEEGSHDVLVHATIIKPKPKMTLAELGMTVWIWGYLCIKSIEKDSIFKHTALKDTDNIISVNEIVCENVSPEQFANIIQALPREITVTVLRRKQRATGNFK